MCFTFDGTVSKKPSGETAREREIRKAETVQIKEETRGDTHGQ